MTVWEYIVYTVFLCVAPAGVIWACRRFSLLGRLGPIMVLYAVGMVVGNMPFLPAGIATLLWRTGQSQVQSSDRSSSVVHRNGDWMFWFSML